MEDEGKTRYADEGKTRYAYRYGEDMDYAVARSKGVPVTGWLHAGGGPPFQVVVFPNPAGEVDGMPHPAHPGG